jgi:hypothetical protein
MVGRAGESSLTNMRFDFVLDCNPGSQSIKSQIVKMHHFSTEHSHSAPFSLFYLNNLAHSRNHGPEIFEMIPDRIAELATGLRHWATRAQADARGDFGWERDAEGQTRKHGGGGLPDQRRPRR